MSAAGDAEAPASAAADVKKASRRPVCAPQSPTEFRQQLAFAIEDVSNAARLLENWPAPTEYDEAPDSKKAALLASQHKAKVELMKLKLAEYL